MASASGGTNWDQGLSQLVAGGQPHYNVVLFITDGDPTTWGPNNNGSGTSTDDTTVNAAITSANAVKAAGTRVIAVGVSNTTGPAVRRLQYISGPTENSDYFVTNWDALQETLVSIATASCQGTITVVKQIHNLDGTTGPGVGWTFSATNSRGPVTPPSGATSSNGTVNFTVPDNSVATLTETQQSGYQLVQQNGSNAVCTSGGNPITSTNVGATGFSVPIGSRQILSCTVVNSLIPATLTLSKTVDNPFGGDADPVDWTLQAAGPQTISGPSGSAAVTGAKVAPGTYLLSELDGPDGYSASAWSCTGASVSGNSVALVAGATVSCGITNTELGEPVLTQDKTVNTATAHEGDTLTYTMTVGNTGTADATGVTATETLPAGVTFVSATASTGTFGSTSGVWTVGTVAVGTTETLTVNVTVNAGTEGSTLVDRFEVTPPPGVGPPEVENPCSDDAAQSCASTDILPPPGSPELVQSKSVDLTTAVPGDTLTYTVGAANDGTADATGVSATDTLPAGVTFVAADTHGAGTYNSSTGIWTIGTVASATSATLTITATVNTGTEATTQINRFIITSTGIPVIVLNACSDMPTESCASTTIPGVPQLVQNKTVDQATAPVGATLTYTMTLGNTGTGDATGVVAHDTMPSDVSLVSADTNGFGTFDATTGTWNIGTIAVGATATLTVTATIEPQAAGSTLVNAFQVVEPPDPPPLVVDNACPTPDEESSCATTTVPGIPQLTQSKVVDAATAVIGQTLTYSMSVGNTGSAESTGVNAQDLLPAGVTFVSADTGGIGSYSPASGVWTIGTVPQGASYTLTITAAVNQGTDNTTQINRFTVNAPSGDPSPVVEQPCADNPEPILRDDVDPWDSTARGGQDGELEERCDRRQPDLHHHDDQHRHRGCHRRRGPGAATVGADTDVGEHERVGHVRSRRLALDRPFGLSGGDRDADVGRHGPCWRHGDTDQPNKRHRPARRRPHRRHRPLLRQPRPGLRLHIDHDRSRSDAHCRARDLGCHRHRPVGARIKRRSVRCLRFPRGGSVTPPESNRCRGSPVARVGGGDSVAKPPSWRFEPCYLSPSRRAVGCCHAASLPTRISAARRARARQAGASIGKAGRYADATCPRSINVRSNDQPDIDVAPAQLCPMPAPEAQSQTCRGSSGLCSR